MRIFLAVFPPAEVLDAAAQVVERLRRPGDGVSWVRRDNLHYTVRFLGELDEPGLARVTLAAREGAARHRAFAARPGTPGAFPGPARARVLWLGLAEGGEALAALARDVELALRQAGLPHEERPFRSHLTLGRVRERDQDWSARLAALPAGPAPPFRVDRVVVVQSTLGAAPRDGGRGAGSRYDVRAEAELAP